MITARIRRLAANDAARLYVAFSASEIARTGMQHLDLVEIDLDGRAAIRGIIKTSGGSPWLAPRSGNSNAEIDRVLRSAEFRFGDEISATFRKASS